MEERAWPYPILKPEAEWTVFDRDYIDLMRAAYAEGYNPRERGGSPRAGVWMRGRSLESLLRDFEFVGGYPAGIVLRPEVVTPSLVLRRQDAESGAAADGGA